MSLWVFSSVVVMTGWVSVEERHGDTGAACAFSSLQTICQFYDMEQNLVSCCF